MPQLGAKIYLMDGASCANNSAPRGGGGCIFWDPLADLADSAKWASFGPYIEPIELDKQVVSSGNTAAYGNETATAPTSLIPLTLKADAPAGGDILHPALQVQLLDFYKSKVVGHRAQKVEINVEVVAGSMGTNGAKGTTVAGGVKSFSSVSGTAIFESLRLVGKPDSAPIASFSQTHRSQKPLSHITTCGLVYFTSQRDDWRLPPRTPAWSARNAASEIGNCPSTAILMDLTIRIPTSTNTAVSGVLPAALVEQYCQAEHTDRSSAGGRYQKTRRAMGRRRQRNVCQMPVRPGVPCWQNAALEGIWSDGKQDLALKNSLSMQLAQWCNSARVSAMRVSPKPRALWVCAVRLAKHPAL